MVVPESESSASSSALFLSSLVQRWLQFDSASGVADATDEADADTGTTGEAADSSLVLRTLRIYGSLYAVSLLLFTILRRLFPRAYNVREWSPTQQCSLAKDSIYHNPISWLWQVFAVSDLELHDQCGMDAVCFLRALRFGRKLAFLGCCQAVYLIPIYYTGGAVQDPNSNNNNTNNNNINAAIATIDLRDADFFAKISIDNVASSSHRLLGTVVAAYVCYFYTFYLILQEYKWYTAHRHKFLSETTPRNYAVYVSGIPASYQSSHQLHAYFSQCSKNDAVLEAHIVLHPDWINSSPDGINSFAIYNTRWKWRANTANQ
jgi:calcium permeable stress-gated cation channel